MSKAIFISAVAILIMNIYTVHACSELVEVEYPTVRYAP